MKKQMIKFFILAVSAVLLFFVTNIFLCSPSGIAPEIKDITDIRILELVSDSIKLDVSVIVLNKNDSDLELDDIYGKLIINKDTIGSLFRDEKLRIKRFDTSTVDIFARLYTPSVIKIASEKKDIISLRLEGKVTADLGIIEIPVEIELDHELDLRKALTETIENDTKNNKLLKVQKARLISFNLSKSAVEVEFILTNPYGVDIILKDYPSKIFINEKESGRGNISSEIKLHPQKSISDCSVVYQLSNVKTISSLVGSILKRKLNYRTSGILHLEVLSYNIQLPFNFKGELIKI